MESYISDDEISNTGVRIQSESTNAANQFLPHGNADIEMQQDNIITGTITFKVVQISNLNSNNLIDYCVIFSGPQSRSLVQLL